MRRPHGWIDPATEERELKAALAVVREAQQHAIRARVVTEARDRLLTFTRYTMYDPAGWHDPTSTLYKTAPYHEAIARALEDVEKGKYTQLIVCLPPRHGKSELATRRLAAWYSGRHPEHNIAIGAYSDTLAENFGGDIRAIMNTHQFKHVFPQHALRQGGKSKSNIQTQQGGRIVSVGRGGALTGHGAHLLLLDDVFKDHEEARSPTIRDQAWNWFTKVAMTRRMGLKLVVLTMTRWHSDDIIGRLTDRENPFYPGDEEAKAWKIIRLPAIAEEDDPAGRAVGEPLWPDGPDRFDIPFLRSQQRLDALGFEALYQQNPTIAEGTLFKREDIRFYDTLPAELRYYAASDHAVATAQRNDRTCLLKLAVDTAENVYVTDCYWRRAPTDQVVEAMLALAGGSEAVRPVLWFAGRDHITKSIGPFLKKRMVETGTYITLRELTPIGDKQQRAQAIAARMATGKVYFPRNAPWVERAIGELLAFPSGTHDDFVDALAEFGRGMQSQFKAAPPKPRDQPPAFGTLGWVKHMDAMREKHRRRMEGAF